MAAAGPSSSNAVDVSDPAVAGRMFGGLFSAGGDSETIDVPEGYRAALQAAQIREAILRLELRSLESTWEREHGACELLFFLRGCSSFEQWIVIRLGGSISVVAACSRAASAQCPAFVRLGGSISVVAACSRAASAQCPACLHAYCHPCLCIFMCACVTICLCSITPRAARAKGRDDLAACTDARRTEPPSARRQRNV